MAISLQLHWQYNRFGRGCRKRSRNSMQKRTTSFPGPDRASQHHLIPVQGETLRLTKEAERTAAARSSSDKVHESRATETKHSKDSHQAWPGSRQSSNEPSDPSFKMKQAFLSRTDSRPSTRPIATSPPGQKTIKTTNV